MAGLTLSNDACIDGFFHGLKHLLNLESIELAFAYFDSTEIDPVTTDAVWVARALTHLPKLRDIRIHVVAEYDYDKRTWLRELNAAYCRAVQHGRKPFVALEHVWLDESGSNHWLPLVRDLDLWRNPYMI